MNRKVTFGVLLSSLLLLHSPTKEAAAQGFTDMGKRTSSAMVSTAWNSLGQDCHRADKLLQIIGDAVDRTARDIRNRKFTGRSAVEFGNGYIAGLTNSLETIIKKCTNECSMMGQASGTWSANIYCAVSEVIGQPAEFIGIKDFPNLICGEAYRMSCESTFVSKCNQMCSQYARGQNFDNFYPASRRGCCAYDRP